MSNRYKLGILGLVVAVILAVLGIVSMTGANATGADKPCTDVVTVVDSEAYTEVVEHPAVVEVIHHEAVTETTPAIWANWSPNDTKGPQDYVPVWPEDDRGTWHVHDQGVPPGHEGPDGVYQKGGGNSPFFYRQAESVLVISPAYDETVVVEEAYTETIHHPAVTHQETVKVECPKTPEEPPVKQPETPENPTDKTDEPNKPVVQKNPVPPAKKAPLPQVPTVVASGK